VGSLDTVKASTLPWFAHCDAVSFAMAVSGFSSGTAEVAPASLST